MFAVLSLVTACLLVSGCETEKYVAGTNFSLRGIGRSQEMHPERIALLFGPPNQRTEIWPAIVAAGPWAFDGNIIFGSRTPEGQTSLFGATASGQVVELSRHLVGPDWQLLGVDRSSDAFVVSHKKGSELRRDVVTNSEFNTLLQSRAREGRPTTWGGFTFLR